jgi:hypothetical protein
MLEPLVSRFIYYPEPEWWATPEQFGLEAGEITLTPEPGVQLHAWLFPVESTFSSIRTLARLIFPLPLPDLPVKYDSRAKIGRIRVALLAIHGEEDELIPCAGGRALFEAAPEPKTWLPIPGAGHNDTYLVGGQEYFDRLARFAREVHRDRKT